MGETKEPKKTNQWILFIGVVLLLFGIYGLARTGINVFAFEKYPQEGVYPPFPFFQASFPPVYYGGREEDCIVNNIYPPLGYTTMPDLPELVGDGVSVKRPPTEEEKKAMEKQLKDQQILQQKSCLSGIKEAREKAKVNDLSQSVLFLFLGAGVLIARRIFK